MKSPKFSGKPKRPKLLLIRRVSGDSMLPTLRPGRLIIATPRYKNLRAGEVVVIRHGGLEKVKRIQEIRENRVYVAGDNQEHSTDSRSFGWLHISAAVAKVVWPRGIQTPDL
jgi:nickel-type superoxide dismutase maturation protease